MVCFVRSSGVTLWVRCWVIFSLSLSLLAPTDSWAGQFSYEVEESQIPKSPSQPPPLVQNAPKFIPHCERYYLFEGKKFECDSNLGQDGERLRSIMAEVPSALVELDAYQQNLKNIRTAAYVGTAGILAMVLGVIMNRPPVDPVSGALRPGAYVMLVGFGVTVNSLIYGLSVVKTNEAHLAHAVNYYNQARPDRMIELQFSTQVNF